MAPSGWTQKNGETGPLFLKFASPTADAVKMETYVQIGAGAGDQDARANFRDGFTEFVKRRHPGQVSRIVLVEPNPFNIAALKACWKDHPQAEILQMGVCPTSHQHPSHRATFYYAEEDAPCYQSLFTHALPC